MFSGKTPKPTFKSYLPPVQTDLKKSPQVTIRKLEAKLLPASGNTSSSSLAETRPLPPSHPCFSSPRRGDGRTAESHDPTASRDLAVTRLVLSAVNDAKGKQKVLGSNKKLKFNPTELILYCKDFRIIRFRFDEAGPESAKKVCLAIAHYSHPADTQLLFGFEYVGTRFYSSSGERVNGVDPGGGLQTPLYDCSSDWDREIKRTGASEWRVCSINKEYLISPSLPEFFVVPSSLADQDLKQYACFFSGQRVPLWCWNHPNGSALVRMSSITEPLQQRKLDQRICSAVMKSHPMRSDVQKMEVDKGLLPTVQDVQAALVKLRQICVIEPFEESESKWLSSVETSRWMEYVRAFLKYAVEVVYILECKQASVILQEEEDRDLSCMVASLVQVMCDPHCRSLVGFQGLVQKEWVMAGHRFLDRCNHLKRNDKEESPLFLLFLNCVWQLLDQHPTAFQFTEVYLSVLSDSMWLPVFSTFLFNCPRQRAEHSRDFALTKRISLGQEQALHFPPVWDWSQQFSPRDQALFNNPLYVGKSAPCVHNGTVRTYSHRRSKRVFSSTLRGVPTAMRNGSLAEHDTLSRRGSLVSRLRTDSGQARELQQESPAERFLHDCLSRPAEPHGLLLPHLLPSHLPLWRLHFLRWVPEARIPHGGPVTAFRELSLLADEIDTLQKRLRQYAGGPTPDGPAPEPGRMYFKAGASPCETVSPPDYLSSSFPFSPVGNLCRRSILGTPLSKILNGAKIWLSTETLANDAV
ncbi:myotubularin-related protein 10 [Brachyhypopomus gauderio]|uniref:myotubularin-related protein 10 n=1 Tax=Brachyhypopomus gauderio TaxID=698409 RepID=UPI0040426D76